MLVGGVATIISPAQCNVRGLQWRPVGKPVYAHLIANAKTCYAGVVAAERQPIMSPMLDRW
jgi:hypothetical protein